MEENRVVYHRNEELSSPNFDLEDSFNARLNQIIGVADLFYVMGESGEREVTSQGAMGIHNVLEDAAEELRTICYFMMEKEEIFLARRAQAAGIDLKQLLEESLNKNLDEAETGGNS